MTEQAVHVPQHSGKGHSLGYQQTLPVVLQKKTKTKTNTKIGFRMNLELIIYAHAQVFTA